MLSLTVNAAAEKIIRQELQRLGAPTRFLIVPGGGSGQVAAAVAAPLERPAAFRRLRSPVPWSSGRERYSRLRSAAWSIFGK
jgi:hypothetical protein